MCTAALKAYCISPVLEVPTCTARRPPPTASTKRVTHSRERRNCGREMTGNFADKWRVPRHLKGSFACRISATWDRRLYFPSEGRNAEDFFFRPEKSDGFGRGRTRELGYQRPADHRSRLNPVVTRWHKPDDRLQRSDLNLLAPEFFKFF
jgi:hypothetical protein